MFGVAVNHFYKKGHPISVVSSTKFALSLLKNCCEVTTVVLVDGSEERNEELALYCDSLDIQYKHAGTTLSFAEGYNLGVSGLQEQWVVTMASDIYVYPDTFTRFKTFIVNHPGLAIGCLIPYLSASDYPPQENLRMSHLPECYAPMMTLNLNVFAAEVYRQIGGLSVQYTGNFNDIDATLKIQRLGKSVFLVDSYAQHYGSLTLQHGTNVNYGEDNEAFFSAYPELKSANGLWSLRHDKFFRSPLLRGVYQVAASNFLKGRHRTKAALISWTFRMVPKTHRI